MRTSGQVFLFLCLGFWGFLACGQTALFSSFAFPPVSAENNTPPTIVIGFVGGFVSHEDTARSGVQLAARLRADFPSGVYAKVFENRRREQAHQEITQMLDTNHDGSLSEEEKRNARIIIYGISWGGSETVQLARELDAEKIPVLLTIQVDSVAKKGQNDRTIPANVAEAINFYQPDGFLHGQSEIQAADPSRTRVLGNFRYDYKMKPIDCQNYPWYDYIFWKPHTEIECDPAVWGRVDSLIRSKLPPAHEGAHKD